MLYQTDGPLHTMMIRSNFTGMCDKICYWSVNRHMDAIVTYDATSTVRKNPCTPSLPTTLNHTFVHDRQ